MLRKAGECFVMESSYIHIVEQTTEENIDVQNKLMMGFIGERVYRIGKSYDRLKAWTFALKDGLILIPLAYSHITKSNSLIAKIIVSPVFIFLDVINLISKSFGIYQSNESIMELSKYREKTRENVMRLLSEVMEKDEVNRNSMYKKFRERLEETKDYSNENVLFVLIEMNKKLTDRLLEIEEYWAERVFNETEKMDEYEAKQRKIKQLLEEQIKKLIKKTRKIIVYNYLISKNKTKIGKSLIYMTTAAMRIVASIYLCIPMAVYRTIGQLWLLPPYAIEGLMVLVKGIVQNIVDKNSKSEKLHSEKRALEKLDQNIARKQSLRAYSEAYGELERIRSYYAEDTETNDKYIEIISQVKNSTNNILVEEYRKAKNEVEADLEPKNRSLLLKLVSHIINIDISNEKKEEMRQLVSTTILEIAETRIEKIQKKGKEEGKDMDLAINNRYIVGFKKNEEFFWDSKKVDKLKKTERLISAAGASSRSTMATIITHIGAKSRAIKTKSEVDKTIEIKIHRDIEEAIKASIKTM